MSNEDVCEIKYINKKAVKEVKLKLLENDLINMITEIFKIIGDPTRVKILQSLSLNELCVCDIAEVLSMTHSAVSHQLRVLRSKNLVKFRKEGKIVYYSLADEHVIKIIDMAIKHIKE
jgi:DNA-binding transcriptional ArsR family regulator